MKCSVTLSRGSCRVHFHSIHEIQTVAKFFFSCLDLFDSCDVGRGELLASVKFGPSFEDTGKGVTRLGSSELIINIYILFFFIKNIRIYYLRSYDKSYLRVAVEAPASRRSKEETGLQLCGISLILAIMVRSGRLFAYRISLSSGALGRSMWRFHAAFPSWRPMR